MAVYLGPQKSSLTTNVNNRKPIVFDDKQETFFAPLEYVKPVINYDDHPEILTPVFKHLLNSDSFTPSLKNELQQKLINDITDIINEQEEEQEEEEEEEEEMNTEIVETTYEHNSRPN
jgi:arginyl-tRNA synthetase